MVETKEIKEKFKKCIDTTIIFCTNVKQVKFLGKMYDGKSFQTLCTNNSDIEIYFTKNYGCGWQDGYNFTYFKKHRPNWKSITFDELINYKKIYELW